MIKPGAAKPHGKRPLPVRLLRLGWALYALALVLPAITGPNMSHIASGGGGTMIFGFGTPVVAVVGILILLVTEGFKDWPIILLALLGLLGNSGVAVSLLFRSAAEQQRLRFLARVGCYGFLSAASLLTFLAFPEDSELKLLPGYYVWLAAQGLMAAAFVLALRAKEKSSRSQSLGNA